MKHNYIECECYSPEHVMRITSYPEDKEVIVTIFLSKCSFIKRLKNSILYLMGNEPRYGHFSDTIINDRQLKKLRKLIDNTVNGIYHD